MTYKPNTNITFDLANKVCIVTGGAQGIGQACAERFAREGARVVIADVVAFLASNAASYMTGEIVVVDGGRMALNYTV